jgi:hypothetical protein
MGSKTKKTDVPKKVKKIKKVKKVRKVKKAKGSNGNGGKKFRGPSGTQRSEKEIRELLARLAISLAENKTMEETCEELNIRYQDYNMYVERLRALETADLLGMTEMDRFVEYCRNQTKLIRDMEDLKETFKASKQYNALVGATRLQSDIYDKMIKTGQELGIIIKTPESVNIIGGLDVRSLSDVQIRNEIASEIEQSQKLLEGITKKKSKPIRVLGPGKEVICRRSIMTNIDRVRQLIKDNPGKSSCQLSGIDGELTPSQVHSSVWGLLNKKEIRRTSGAGPRGGSVYFYVE